MKRQNGSRFLNVFSLHAGRNLQKHYAHDNPIVGACALEYQSAAGDTQICGLCKSGAL